MEKKMRVMGVGGIILTVFFVFLIATLIIDKLYTPMLRIAPKGDSVLLIVGITLTAVGFTLNLIAAFTMLKAHAQDRYAETGMYRLFRDPMYVFQILITLPGILLIVNSWLAMLSVIPTYIAYRIAVRKEHRYLEQRYGEAYIAYTKTVLIPFL